MDTSYILKKFKPEKDNLLEIFHALQKNNEYNYLSEDDIKAVSEYLNITLSSVKGTVSYYSMFSTKPRGRHIIRLCKSPVCSMIGSASIAETINEKLGIMVGETTDDRMFTFELCECLGQCHQSPAMMIDGKVYTNLTETKVKEIFEEILNDEKCHSLAEKRVVLKNVGRIDPLSIDDYIELGGYSALKKAMNVKSEEIIESLIEADFIGSSLRGRGGAGFPTGLKVKFTKSSVNNEQKQVRYLVCNADEGEPGTFKDRIIMENDPHTLIEGMAITAYAIEAKKAYIYIRGEYTESIRALNVALEVAKRRGYLGENILGSSFSLDIELKLGGGSYLCGEELTLLESLEGKRGYPRIKPPFPAECGLFGKPTLVNNVETISNIPSIIINGPEWYRKLGTEKSPGTKIFTISGYVKRPGYYEAELGVTLRELIYGFGGGISGNGMFKAALLGGAAGTFVDESMLDVKMGFDELKEKGATLGSGAVIVMDTSVSIASILQNILGFFKHESCGKCTPCRVGTAQLIKLFSSINCNEREKSLKTLKKIEDLCIFMSKNSLCPLGQSPILPVESAIRYFKDELLG